MTFIASVIAKRGVAIIADSLVTTVSPLLDFPDYLNFLRSKTADPSGQIILDPAEVVKLFRRRPVHTRDFQEKIFKFDKFTAISTAGASMLNGKTLKK